VKQYNISGPDSLFFFLFDMDSAGAADEEKVSVSKGRKKFAYAIQDFEHKAFEQVRTFLFAFFSIPWRQAFAAATNVQNQTARYARALEQMHEAPAMKVWLEEHKNDSSVKRYYDLYTDKDAPHRASYDALRKVLSNKMSAERKSALDAAHSHDESAIRAASASITLPLPLPPVPSSTSASSSALPSSSQPMFALPKSFPTVPLMGQSAISTSPFSTDFATSTSRMAAMDPSQARCVMTSRPSGCGAASKLSAAAIFNQSESARLALDATRVKLAEKDLKLRKEALKMSTSDGQKWTYLTRDKDVIARLPPFSTFLDELDLKDFQTALEEQHFLQPKHLMGHQWARLEKIFDDLHVPAGIKLNALRDLCDPEWWAEIAKPRRRSPEPSK
jgi:hypothetical protein